MNVQSNHSYPSRCRSLGAFAAVMALGFSAPSLSAQKTGAADDIVTTAVKAGSFKTLAAALKAAGLVDTLRGEGPFTVFAPTDEAFAKLPKHVLQGLLKPKAVNDLVTVLTYHVVPGRVSAGDGFGVETLNTVSGQRLDLDFGAAGLGVDKAKVVQADIACSNGVIHVIDTVMIPSLKSIPETAKAAGGFDTLLAAAKAAGLVDALSGDGPLTVFAPTDDAFARLPKGTLESLLKPENKDQLAAILKLHVVAGRVFSGAALQAGKAMTLQGQDVRITVGAGGLRVNDAPVVATDLDARNGVIHVIDAVLLPRMLSTAEVVAALEVTVDAGAPEFNRGQFSRCAEIYKSACERIASSASPDVDRTVIRILELSAARANAQRDAKTRAWDLRAGIDLAYYALQQRGSLGAH